MREKLAPKRKWVRHAYTGKLLKWGLLVISSVLLTASLQAQDPRFTMNLKNVSLPAVFNAVEQQSTYSIFYKSSLVENTPKVTVVVKDATLAKVMELCLSGRSIKYEIIGQSVILSPEKGPAVKSKTNPSSPSGADSLITLSGRVRCGKDGIPLPGATVKIKGTSIGTATDAGGVYILKHLGQHPVIVVSSIGYETRELAATNNTIDIVLQPATSVLDETQVIAYGTTSKRLNTGAVSTVKAETIEKQPVGNVLSALSGQVPGLAITQSSGVPGANVSVRIRGLNSLAGANEPLVLIDGVPFSSSPIYNAASVTQAFGGSSPLSAVNPNDIETLEVLKDADATAIYGSRGANGVILITTKKGKAGKTALDVNVYKGIGKTSRKLDLLSRRQYLDMRYGAFENDGVDWRDSRVRANDLKVWDTTRYTDWQKELTGGKANYTNAQVTLSGGSEKTNFSLNGTYWKETSVYPGSFSNQKYSGRFGLTHRSANDRFRLEFSSFYLFNDNRLPFYDMMWGAIMTPPVAPAAFTDDGQLNWANGTFGENPMAYQYQQFEAKSNNFNASSLLSYNITRGLWIRANVGLNRIDHEMTSLTPKKSLNPFSPWGVISMANFQTNATSGWNVEPYVEYEFMLGPGKMHALAGTTLQSSVNKNTQISASNFADDDLMRNPAAAASVQFSPPGKTDYRYNAVFGRLNYNLDNKYIVNLTVRRDGSSRFGPGRQFGNFGAAGAAWIFSEEPFVKKALPFLSYGKLRASYGVTGSDAIGDYAFLPTYAMAWAPYAGVIPMYPERLYNADFGWETNKKTDLQLDLGFIKGRILLSANYYRNLSGNQLVGMPLPATAGFQSISGNLPATVRNTGWEFSLNTINVQKEDFSWTSALNLTIPRNKLISYPGLEYSSQSNRYAIGHAISLEKTYNYIQVNPSTGLNVFRGANGKDTSFVASTFFTEKDLTVFIETMHHYFGGLTNSIQYKGLSLDFTFQFSKVTRRIDLPGIRGNVPGFAFNQSAYVFENSWKKPGDQALYQRFTQTTNSAAYRSRQSSSSSGLYEDVSFIRLNNVSLSYQLPSSWQKALHTRNCRIYMLGQNLLTITDFKGLDPEGANTALPRLRVLTAGVQLSL